MSEIPGKIGLIAGNGKFPLLVLDAARSKGLQVVVAAIKEEAFPEIERNMVPPRFTGCHSASCRSSSIPSRAQASRAPSWQVR